MQLKGRRVDDSAEVKELNCTGQAATNGSPNLPLGRLILVCLHLVPRFQ